VLCFSGYKPILADWHSGVMLPVLLRFSTLSP